MRIPWRLCRLFSIYVRKITGHQQIPQGNFIVAANHLSSLDMIVIMIALRRRVTYVADQRLVKNWLRKFVVYWLGRSIPNGHKAIERAKEVIDQNKILCVFPEGDIHPQHRDGYIHTGVMVLSHQTQVPILPIKITGTGKIWPPQVWPLKPWRFFSSMVTIGRPVLPLPPHKKFTKEEYGQQSIELMENIMSL